jgi:hypothetical protein
MLSHQTEGPIELNQMIWAGVGQREPTAGREYSSRLDKISRREDADNEIGADIPNRPCRPQISHRESELWPALRGSTRRTFCNVEAQSDHRRSEGRGYLGQVIAGAKTCIDHAPIPGRGRSAGPPHARDHVRRDSVKVAGQQE